VGFSESPLTSQCATSHACQFETPSSSQGLTEDVIKLKIGSRHISQSSLREHVNTLQGSPGVSSPDAPSPQTYYIPRQLHDDTDSVCTDVARRDVDVFPWVDTLQDLENSPLSVLSSVATNLAQEIPSVSKDTTQIAQLPSIYGRPPPSGHDQQQSEEDESPDKIQDMVRQMAYERQVYLQPIANFTARELDVPSQAQEFLDSYKAEAEFQTNLDMLIGHLSPGVYLL
jgi:hypothetical protein